jgi:hypothetical protein
MPRLPRHGRWSFGIYGTVLDHAEVSPDSKPSAKLRELNTAIDSCEP